MMQLELYYSERMPDAAEKKAVISFLSEHLGEYGDPETDIEKAMDYALSADPLAGGFILAAKEEEEMVGAAVVNNTGMKGYIPEHILVYIATHGQRRGKGIGKKILEKIMDTANGDIALHVEPHNPAKGLYEKYGFTNKYLEMRLKQKA